MKLSETGFTMPLTNQQEINKDKLVVNLGPEIMAH